jgi:hypothetical protein
MSWYETYLGLTPGKLARFDYFSKISVLLDKFRTLKLKLSLGLGAWILLPSSSVIFWNQQQTIALRITPERALLQLEPR